MRPAFHKLGAYSLKMRGYYVVYNNIAPCGGGGYHVCSGLYLVRYYGICAAVQLPAAVYPYNVGTGALHLRAHHVQKVCRVNNMRLLGGVRYYRAPLSAYGSKHYVYRCAYGYYVKIYLRAHEPVSLGGDYAPLYLHIRAQGPEALYVLVYGTLAYGAAAWQRDLRIAIAAEHCAEKIV